MHQIPAILAKEAKILTRDRQALALLFAMPAFFIPVMSYALMGVFETGTKTRPFEVVAVSRDPGRLSREVISDLRGAEGFFLLQAVDGIPLTQERAEELVRKGQYPLALLIPEGFSEKTLSWTEDPAQKATVTFIHDPATNVRLLSGIKGTMQGIILRRALLATLPARLKKAWAADMGPFAAFAGPDSKNTERQIDELLAKAGKGAESQRAPEVKSCYHRKNHYVALNIAETTNFRKIFLQLLRQITEL